jgi:hypothetical protein
LDHQDVDDPTSSSNGIIKVEFRKAEHQNDIKINPDFDLHEPTYFIWPPMYKEDNNGPRPQWTFSGGYEGSTAGTMGDVASDNVMYSSSNMNSKMKCCAGGEFQSRSFTAPGATVEGSKSNQQFTYSNLEVEDHAVVLKLKIVGIEKRDTMRDTEYKYCTQCGQRVKRVAKYCSECGHRI